MSNITQVLTVFGENFYLVVVLCVEILIAVVLFGMTINICIQSAGIKPAIQIEQTGSRIVVLPLRIKSAIAVLNGNLL